MQPSVRFGAAAHRLFAGLLFLLGGVVAYYGWQYGLGQLNDIGPGAFPLGLGILLMALALLSGRRQETTVESRRVAPIVAIPLGIAAWALLVDRIGLLVATLVLIALCGLAEIRPRPLRLGVLAITLALVGYLVFVEGFRLPLTLWAGF